MGEKLVIYQIGFLRLHTKPEDLLALSRILRENNGFNHLADLTALTMLSPMELEIVYHQYSIQTTQDCDKGHGTRQYRNCFGISGMATADWQEREV